MTVLGNPLESCPKGRIETELDGKKAVTEFEVIEAGDKQSRLRVNILTGRKHQIRRHFDAIGHPVMGDPRYGSGNKNKEGMQLKAVELRFECPIDGERREFVLMN